MPTDAENTRNCMNMQKSHMKLKFRSPNNLELCWTVLHKNEKSFFPKLHMDIFVENWYTLVQGHRKMLPFLSYEVPPLATPTTNIIEYI